MNGGGDREAAWRRRPTTRLPLFVIFRDLQPCSLITSCTYKFCNAVSSILMVSAVCEVRNSVNTVISVSWHLLIIQLSYHGAVRLSLAALLARAVVLKVGGETILGGGRVASGAPNI